MSHAVRFNLSSLGTIFTRRNKKDADDVYGQSQSLVNNGLLLFSMNILLSFNINYLTFRVS